MIRSPVTTMRVNMIGSANVLEAAAMLDSCERVVCFSTSEVFGQHAFRSSEADSTVMGQVGEARWTYAVSKLAEEHLAIAYHAELGLPVTVVRPFNVYGPGQVGEGAMRIFIERAVENLPIEIHGDGTQIRAWCYVDDMVRGVLIALTHPERRRRIVQHRQPTGGHHDLRSGQHRRSDHRLDLDGVVRAQGLRRCRTARAVREQGSRSDRIRGIGRPRRRHRCYRGVRSLTIGAVRS